MAHNLELVIAHYVRTEYEDKFSKTHIPIALKSIIQLFSRRTIESKIITIQEDMEFIKLISSKLTNIKQFKLLYRSSEHEYSAKKFHQLCDGHGPTITIIENQFGNVFGGYTKIEWKTATYCDTYYGAHWEDVESDKTAFLFVIRSKDQLQKVPDIFEYQDHVEQDNAVRHNEGYGPIFGDGPSIRINDKCNVLFSHTYIPEDEERCFMSYNHDGQELCGGTVYGGKQDYTIQDYEVFEVK